MNNLKIIVNRFIAKNNNTSDIKHFFWGGEEERDD